jgi:serine/threonine-protein kinase HipA
VIKCIIEVTIYIAFGPRRNSSGLQSIDFEMPLNDLVPYYGSSGEQSMLVMGEGRNLGTAKLQALGKQDGIKKAPQILAKVKRAVANWPRYAGLAGVSRKSVKEIAGKIGLQ